jgi:hypothetical protein
MSSEHQAKGYWKVLEPYWDRIDIYDGPERFLATYRTMPAVVQILYAAHFCESEVANGGLHQFFMNPTGVLAPEAVQAFRAINFSESAAILERAMQFFGTPYQRDQEARIERLESVTGETPEQWNPFFHLDEELDISFGVDHRPFYDALDRFASA